MTGFPAQKGYRGTIPIEVYKYRLQVRQRDQFAFGTMIELFMSIIPLDKFWGEDRILQLSNLCRDLTKDLYYERPNWTEVIYRLNCIKLSLAEGQHIVI